MIRQNDFLIILKQKLLATTSISQVLWTDIWFVFCGLISETFIFSFFSSHV